MKGNEVLCPYCGYEAQFVDSIAVYRKSYGMIYLCWPCDARVGVHKGTDKPLGRLANAELRKAKIAAHSAFDPMWRNATKSRRSAYKWLAEQLGIEGKDCHIGMFDVDMCQKVIEVTK